MIVLFLAEAMAVGRQGSAEGRRRFRWGPLPHRAPTELNGALPLFWHRSDTAVTLPWHRFDNVLTSHCPPTLSLTPPFPLPLSPLCPPAPSYPPSGPVSSCPLLPPARRLKLASHRGWVISKCACHRRFAGTKWLKLLLYYCILVFFDISPTGCSAHLHVKSCTVHSSSDTYTMRIAYRKTTLRSRHE